jgi:hypothetical protein
MKYLPPFICVHQQALVYPYAAVQVNPVPHACPLQLLQYLLFGGLQKYSPTTRFVQCAVLSKVCADAASVRDPPAARPATVANDQPIVRLKNLFRSIVRASFSAARASRLSIITSLLYGLKLLF